jgi:glycosyltransferase involved in cell wall biosynthesis
MRVPFGVPVDAPLIGIVGRYQRYRKMDVFLAAARLLVDRLPQVRFLAIGRSGKMRETVVEPMARLGLQQHVLLTGYRIGDYVDVMGALDVFTLLMPGFDGTARAVREALALGIPCVVSDFGMLPEVVRHGQTGLVVPMDDPAALAQAWYELATNVARRQAMADAARRDAEARFRIELVGPCLEEFYARLLRLRPPAGGGTAPA